MTYITILCNFMPLCVGREFSLSFLLPDKKSELPSSHQSRSRSSTNASQREGINEWEESGYASSNNGSGQDGESFDTRNEVGKCKLMTLRAENLLVHLSFFLHFFLRERSSGI